jgi:hypothetical protein
MPVVSKMKNPKSTEQLNLRMPKELLDDLDTISDILKVNKSEWIKIKLGEIVYDEKNRLLEQQSRMKKLVKK